MSESEKRNKMKYLIKALDIVVYGLTYILYVCMKAMYIFSPYKTIMPFIVWNSDDIEMRDDIIKMGFITILIIAFIFMGWWSLLIPPVVLIGIGAFLLYRAKQTRKLYNQDYDNQE